MSFETKTDIAVMFHMLDLTKELNLPGISNTVNI